MVIIRQLHLFFCSCLWSCRGQKALGAQSAPPIFRPMAALLPLSTYQLLEGTPGMVRGEKGGVVNKKGGVVNNAPI